MVVCASLHLFAHLVVLSIDCFVYWYVAGYSTHSSNDIIMSAPKASSISIPFSGEKKCLLPSKCDLNSTPSSLIVLKSLKLNTWNPPQSVSIGLSQFMNLCSPPASFTISCPGLKYKWYVFDNIICAPTSSFSSSGVIDFTVACVPTGINTGVCMSPCGVCTTPLLAPVCLHLCNSSYVTAGFIYFKFLLKHICANLICSFLIFLVCFYRSKTRTLKCSD